MSDPALQALDRLCFPDDEPYEFDSEWVRRYHADGSLRGFLAVEKGPSGIFVARIGVHPDIQRQGIGRILLRRTGEIWPMRAFTYVIRHNVPALRLFLAAGFHPYWPDFGQDMADAVFLEKLL